MNASLDAYSGNIDDMKAAMLEDPNLSFSRMLSPRRLSQDTNYQCFLIPSFETGRLAGLGESIENVPYHQPSWDVNNMTEDKAWFPYYYTWEFTTADSGDFETLANKIKPRPAADIGTTVTFSMEDCGVDVPAGTNALMEFEGALVAPNFNSEDFVGAATNAEFIGNLSTYLNSEILEESNLDNLDPTLVAASHGKWLVDDREISLNNPANWYKDLNLDPRNRAIAGFGASIVKEYQEEFMTEAWSQVEAVQNANQKIREAKLIGKVGERILDKHVISRGVDLNGDLSEEESAAADRLLLLSRSQIQDYMPVAGTNKTLKQEVDESSAPNALFSGTLRKLTRPGRRMSRSLSANIDGSVTQGLTLALNGDGVVFDDGTESYPLYDEGMDLEGAVSDIAVAFTDINNADVNNVISTAPWGALATVLGGESLLLQSKAEIDLPNIQEEVNPMKRVQDELLQNIQVWNPDVNEGEGDYQNLVELGEIMAYPELDFPLYEYLEKFAKHAILPNLDSIPEDSVTLMQTNPKFIDSLMIGANQEMAKELLWRKYPTDQKGSYFRMFWNKGDSDVTSDQDYYDTDVHAGVDDTLNLHQLPDAWNSSDRLILVMRGELFDKFPGVQIFASKGVMGNHDFDEGTPDQLTHSTNDADIILPEFKAK
ncbi:MAG: hypothetical protein AAF193_05250, partial [Bacteroidota bacterium]